ncbi:MAG: diguanylate cyclase [Sulfurimonas sp.]|uniref:diguanylate cyclase n=1 Tax=Sulfurimonas sp. TaxID=2022749 RepID=UPI0028CC139E|nr:diguanylate cyclase [Sulfurimonas sp.]MDT8339804.1 diguanylate cyclase [Sulfurimonas sp.]
MRNAVFILFFFSSLPLAPLQAQLSAAFQEDDYSFNQGVDLYHESQYAAAMQKFEAVLERNPNTNKAADCAYYIANCAIRLDYMNADQMMEDFVENHPNSPKRNKAYLEVANYYFDQGKYPQSQKWYAKVKGDQLSRTERQQMIFNNSYNAFVAKRYDEAAKGFNQLITHQKYGNDAKYYLGYIAYQQDRYDEAGALFESGNTQRNQNTAYFEADMNFKQGNFEKAITKAQEQLPNSNPKERSQLNKIIGESYFNLEQYDQAIPYLKEYKGLRGKWNNTDYYQLGFAYYHQKDYPKAIAEFNKIIDNHVIVSYADCNGIITDVSKAFCLICGYEKSELIGKSHDVMLDSNETTLINELWKSISLDNQWNGEFKNRKKDGSPFWIDGSIAPYYSFKGERLGYIMVAKDISDRKIVEKLSITDALTNLYNRRFFDEIFQKKLSYAIREKNKFCLFMCDIDNFKNYNDMYGHQMGDKALITISEKLKEYFKRAGDFVFRVGGEEFAAILNIGNSDNIDSFIVKLLENIKDLNIEHKGNPPFGVLTISCGVVVADFAQISKPFSTDEIYKLVDDELYKAKQNGKNRISSFYVS